MSLPDKKETDKENNSPFLRKYAALGTQMLVSIGLSVFAGIKLDGWLRLRFPLLGWLLPLLVIIITLYKIVKDTAPKK